ncbi:aminotransferase class I/II-fold pyridoxal phosphate-dependent enzyme [Cohnella cellulosilytica]|uniref:Aminotransferase class I/II-fold pyridoxal phosphate-dependent enzyme n=1 Tax=Cohnella cellulosilytica TaxID=986710 RepID=A0ABW2FA66_9BACL
MSSIINWMGGWPKEGLVSASDWEDRVEAAAADLAAEEFGSGRREAGGFREEKLREQFAGSLLQGRVGGNGGRIRFTKGADGALSWMIGEALEPGDVVLTERLTSRTALQAFRKAGMRVEAVDGDRKGMDPEALTNALFRYRPKLVYVAPSCTEPEGTQWSGERMAAVRHRCREAGVLLVTDDRQEMLLYEPSPSHPAQQSRMDSGVLSIGQLPPGLIAGARVGWIAGTADVFNRPSLAGEENARKYALGPIEQRALSGLIAEQPLEPLLEMLRIQCRERKRRMTEQLARQDIENLGWTEPRGGLHLWLTLPPGLDGEALLRDAWLKGVIFQPGAPFFTKDPKPNTIRITHAFADDRQIRQGVARLAESIGEFTGRWSRS